MSRLRNVMIEAAYIGKDKEEVDKKAWIVRARVTLKDDDFPAEAGYVLGFRGTPFKEECYPFIIGEKGKVDFGSGYEDDDTDINRFGYTNLLFKKILVSETFNLTEDGEENPYKILRLISL